MSKRHFQQGGRGVFTCCVCGRSTRQVDQGDSECCPQCYELAGHDNYHNDNGIEPNDDELRFYEGIVAEIVAKGGNADKVRKSNEYIW